MVTIVLLLLVVMVVVMGGEHVGVAVVNHGARHVSGTQHGAVRQMQVQHSQMSGRSLDGRSPAVRFTTANILIFRSRERRPLVAVSGSFFGIR